MPNGRNSVRPALVFTLLLVVTACGSPAPKAPDEAQTDASASAKETPSIVAARTSGTISTKSTIRVRFVDDMIQSSQVGVAIAPTVFQFEPALKGIAIWESRRELQFRPEATMPQGTTYQASVNLTEAIGSTHESLELSFQIMYQAYEVDLEGLTADPSGNANLQIASGTLQTADVANNRELEQILTASHLNDDLTVKWDHPTERQHRFTIAGITRRDRDSKLTLKLDGSTIGVDRQEATEITVPGKSNFTVTGVRAVAAKDRHIEIRFSDPVRRQRLRGLIRVGNKPLRFTVSGNIVRVYSNRPWLANESVEVAASIQSQNGFNLKSASTHSVQFTMHKPEIRFPGKGVVLPTTSNFTLPIETRSLRAVEVEAIRVNTGQLPQFFQVNSFGGTRELNRVGRTIWKETVELDPTAQADASGWIRYGLNIEPLVNRDTRGLYRLKVSFKRSHITYPCTEDAPAESLEADLENVDGEQESSFWDNYDAGAMSWHDIYHNRKNPCHAGYYRDFYDHKTHKTRNILVSDIGLMAKLDQNNQLVVVTTNLKTASPLAGVTLQALDYQQTVLAEATSTADGITRLEVPHKPFLVVAKLGNDSNYLRLDDGESLSISHFDTGGQKLKKGLKGFIYGERGVWRPGDPIYLTFVLFDPTDQLPTNHPVHFQLTNSRGQTIQRETRTSSVGGFYHIATKTPADAPTGNYTATFFVGGTRYDKVLKIETVVPNRLKVNLVPEEELVTAPNMKLKAKLESQWLHGAPAENLQVDISSKLRSATTRFSKFSEFVFDDPTRRYQSEREAIYSGKLDQDGNLDLEAKLDVSGNPSGMLRADILTKVYEPSGAFSQASQSVKVSPYAHYVGLRVPKGDKARGMLLTDMNHAVEVVRVDGDGNLSGTGKVQMHLYKMRWRSWWQKGQESLADFVSSNHYQSVQKGTVDLVDGKATWNFQVNYPAWGRYLVTAVDADGKHRSAKVVYIDWPGWAGKQRKDNPGGASVLTLSADEASYDVGQPVTLTMPTSPGARMLVSIETGSRILESKWIESQGERTQYTLNATPDMAPTAYAHVTLIQGHASSQNDAPIRMYGITPIKVVDSTTKLDPILEAPESFEPNSTGKISVRERSGKAMTYTLAVVDEGLLGLTSFKTPNPWDTMYRREALGVKTWDLYDDVAGAFGGKLNKLLSIGGSDEEKEPENKRANRFKPMVEFLGPFTLAAGETRDHAIKIPQYVGAVRAMVVAADTNQGSFGSGEREIFVRKPLMVLATLPRVLGPLEQVKLPISVFAMTPEMRNVSVEVKTEGPLTVRGERKRSLTFTRPGDDIVSFPLEVSQSTGIGVVEITARGHGQTAQHRIEIDVRHANQPVSQLFTAMVEPKANWEAALTMPGMPNTNTATLEVSHLPPLNLEERLGYLIRYPHGCIEQTTSSVFPQLLLSSLMPLTETQSVDIQKNVTAGIERLKTFQVSDGGFGYWPGQSASAWGTNYAGHFLLEAKALGYALPAGMLEQWTSYQRQEAQSWTNNGRDGDQLIQAYRLYGLALAQQPELSAMNRLKQSGNLRLQTRWRLAAAYHLAGQLDVAKNLILGQSTETQAYAGHGNTYGSALRDQALILDTLALMGMKKEAFSIATQISDALSSKSWYSTQSTAFSLLSMIRFAGQAGTQGLEGSYVIGPQKRQTFSTDMPLFSTKLPLPELKRVKMSVTNPSTAPLFVRVLTRGVPKLGKETPASRGLALSVKYTDTEGAPVDVSAMSQGTDFQATITVTNKTLQGRVKDIALSQVVPSGWEIHNERLVSSSPVAKTHFDYQDIRDDRVYTYFDLARGETKTFNIKLNASYEGKFYMPQISVEAMYDGSIYARDYGNWVEVVKPGSEG